MPDEIQMTLELPPLGNRFYRMFRNRMVMSSEARQYKAKVLCDAQANEIEPMRDAVTVFVDVYRQRKAGDLDGYLKVLLDSLQGVAYENDKQIVGIVARRFDDKLRPRVEVTVQAA